MHVAPIKPMLKAPGNRRLKLKHDVPLLNFAFNFKLRRYIMALNYASTINGFTHMNLTKLDVLSGRGLDSSTFQLNLSRF